MATPYFSDADIREAGREVLRGGSFNQDQVRYMVNLRSIDLNASPGSGKTSALLGKLYMLGKQRVWDGGRGVCTLSHTNVAVDEIKSLLGIKYPESTDYPNFVGTLQEFANRFLALPYFRSRYGCDDTTIDDELYIARLHSYLKKRGMLPAIEAKLQPNGLDDLLAGSVFDPAYMNNPRPFQQRNKDGSDNKATKALLDARLKLATEYGCLTYRDAYFLAAAHVSSSPDICRVLRERFEYVFLDEAQDTPPEGLALLDAIFDDASCCYQRIGDPQQDIMDGGENAAGRWQPRTGDRLLHLSDTNRFGPNIARAVSFVRASIDPACPPVTSTQDRSVDACYIVAFDESRPMQAVTTFARIVRQHSETAPIKDVHAVGTYAKRRDDATKLYVGSYNPGYSKESDEATGRRKTYFTEPLQYLSTITAGNLETDGTALIYRRIVELVRRRIREATGKAVAIDAVHDAIAAGDEGFGAIASIARSVARQEPMDSVGLSAALGEIASRASGISVEVPLPLLRPLPGYKETPQPGNAVTIDGAEINFGTVHSVKGRTVDAMLLLTCQFRTLKASAGSLSGTELDYLVKDSAHSINRRRLIYVAMSRPRYVFAWAVPKSKLEVVPQGISSHFTVILADDLVA